MSGPEKGGDGGDESGKPPRTKRAPFREKDPDEKVGPGNPPADHRWPKGHCPNPAGRPRKKVVEMTTREGLSPLQKLILEHAHKVVGEYNGDPVTRLGRLLLKLDATADHEPAIAKALLQLYPEAEKEKARIDLQVLQGAFLYKEKWEPVFNRAAKAGRPPPPIYPHPDDMVILRDGSVKIDGPVTAQQARDLDLMIQFRDAIFMIVEEAMDYPNDIRPVEQTRKLYESYRRKFYRFHNRIPRRLYQPFPKFRTIPRPGSADEQ